MRKDYVVVVLLSLTVAMLCLILAVESFGATIDSKSIRCKEIERASGDGCNSCTVQLCTDGKKQWETMRMCSAVYCGPSKEPYKAEDWK